MAFSPLVGQRVAAVVHARPGKLQTCSSIGTGGASDMTAGELATEGDRMYTQRNLWRSAHSLPRIRPGSRRVSVPWLSRSTYLPEGTEDMSVAWPETPTDASLIPACAA
jgi:hypothetical protein